MKKMIIIILIVTTILSGCAKKNSIDDKNIIVAASSTPHTLILNQTRAYIEEKGYNLVIKTMNDYVIPNTITQSGEVDANFFQHLPYLSDFNSKNNTNLVSVHKVHFEPLGIYSNNKLNFDDIYNTKIGIPNDSSNGARALLLLEKAKLIDLNNSKGLNVTKNDIISNPYNINILELEAAAIPVSLEDLDFGVINGNYALSSNIKTDKLLLSEDINSIAALEYANIIAVHEKNINSEAIKILVEALKQDHVVRFIQSEFSSLVIPITN